MLVKLLEVNVKFFIKFILDLISKGIHFGVKLNLYKREEYIQRLLLCSVVRMRFPIEHSIQLIRCLTRLTGFKGGAGRAARCPGMALIFKELGFLSRINLKKLKKIQEVLRNNVDFCYNVPVWRNDSPNEQAYICYAIQ